MKSSVPVITLLSCGMLVSGQSTATQSTPPSSQTPQSTPASPSTGTSALKVRGPEAVARQDPNKVVATIDGHSITAQQAVDMLKQIPEQQRRTMPSLSNVLQQLYTIDQLSNQAEKLKLDQQSPWKEEIQLNRKQILSQAYMNDLGKNTTAAEGSEAQQYYNTHPGDFEQIRLSGILVAFNAPGTPSSSAAVNRTEADALQKANDLEKKIKAGGDFAALARTDSDHQASATKGGDLGGPFTTTDARLPPEIKTAIAKLKAGEVSEPVRVNGGYFIFKVDSRTTMPFDQVRAEIVKKLQLDKYKIQVQDPDFFASSSAAGSNVPSLQRPTPAAAPQAQTAPAKPPAQ